MVNHIPFLEESWIRLILLQSISKIILKEDSMYLPYSNIKVNHI